MKYGLMTFPAINDSFSGKEKGLLLTQRLEPSVLYVAPTVGQSEFIENNQPREGIDKYLCSVYTRGWEEFKKFSQIIGRENILAGGYHPTAEPEKTLPYAEKVITGYCGNIDEILAGTRDGVIQGSFGFTEMRRDLIDQKSLAQVYPDIRPEHIVGSMVSSVGCPFDCSFCSTPNISGRRMQVAELDYVASEIDNLRAQKVNTVFVRDESFATNPKIVEISGLFRGKFEMVYSFGTGNMMGTREDMVKKLAQNGWHSFNFGLEDIGSKYKKNIFLKQAIANCRKHGIQAVLSFIVNDDNKTKEEARANYLALYEAFIDLKPAQVCANFLMPMPGSGLWNEYKNRIKESDFQKYDSKTPLLCPSELVEWHKKMIVAIQLKYYYSKVYRKEVRNFECGDTLHLRIEELKKQFGFENHDWDQFIANG